MAAEDAAEPWRVPGFGSGHEEDAMNTATTNSIWRQRFLPAIFSLCLAGGLATFAFAQRPPAPPPGPGQTWDNDVNRRELRNWDWFEDRHPGIARDLRANPNLINDRIYIAHHPELRQFLRNHPGVRHEFRENPRAFLHRERRYERHEGREGWRHERWERRHWRR